MEFKKHLTFDIYHYYYLLSQRITITEGSATDTQG